MIQTGNRCITRTTKILLEMGSSSGSRQQLTVPLTYRVLPDFYAEPSRAIVRAGVTQGSSIAVVCINPDGANIHRIWSCEMSTSSKLNLLDCKSNGNGVKLRFSASPGTERIEHGAVVLRIFHDNECEPSEFELPYTIVSRRDIETTIIQSKVN